MPKNTASIKHKRGSKRQFSAPPRLLTIGALTSKTHLLLAHGAGTFMTSPFLTTLSELVNTHNITVHRFEFPYMAERRSKASRRPPPPITKLLDPFEKALQTCQKKLPRFARLFIGGKSMGGRVATLLATDPRISKKISGVILVGYPFHPPAYPQKLRLSQFSTLTIPTLLIQGTRDPFGTKEEIITYPLPSCIETFWIKDADHDLKPPHASGQTHKNTLKEAALAISSFVKAEQTKIRKEKKPQENAKNLFLKKGLKNK